MTVTINGTGTIAGLSTGGLPDGSIDADSLATGAVTSGKLASGTGGKVVQVVHVQTGAFASGTTVMPLDTSIPQITEGTEFMTLAVTPTHASNILHIDVVSESSSETANVMSINALFVGTTASALAVAIGGIGAAANRPVPTTAFRHRMVAGVTTELTFRLRIGPSSSATMVFNGYAGGARFGGTLASSITITEILA